MNRNFLTLFTLLSLCFAINSNAQNPALSLDGTDDYVQTTYGGITGNSARTVEAWIRTTTLADPGSGGIQNVITDYGSMSTGGRFTFNVLQNNCIRIEVGGSGLYGQTPVNDGYWHHVAAVYDPSATLKFRLYVDGQLDTAGNITTTVNTNSTNDFMIGRRNDNTRYFTGDIDEVRVWDHARTDSAIAADMNREFCGSLPNGLVAYFRLNEGNPNGSNFGNTSAQNYASNKNGTLLNFSLSGSSSNWINGPYLSGGNTSDTISIFECGDYTSPAGNTYSFSGSYIETISNSNGCDSVITINLTVGRNYAYVNVDACDSFVNQSGRIRRTSGLIRDTFFSSNYLGCDSIHIWNVTINKSQETNSVLSSCDSALVNDVWYWTSQMIYDTLVGSNGCDSVHHTDLTILYPGNGQLDTTVCGAYTSPSGKDYYDSGLYLDTLFGKSVNGCDSIIQISLTVNKPSIDMHVVSGCDSFVSASGKVYKQSGLYVEEFTNRFGCDSTVKYDLTMYFALTLDLETMDCDSALVNGSWFYEDTMAVFTFTGLKGCDSIERHDIRVISIDTAVLWDGTTFTAQQDDAEYQWYDCSDNMPIDGETSQSFTPKKNGDYLVLIRLNDCVKNGACWNVSHFLGLQELEEPAAVKIYPNPGNGTFTISSENALIESYRIINLQGKEIEQSALALAHIHTIRTDLPAGTYIMELQTDRGLLRVLLIQKN